MERSVEDFCSLLVRSRLLPALEVRNLRQRWQAESGKGSGDAESFSKWLVDHSLLTPYQAGLLQRGKCERIVLNEYRILDRIGQGRMAAVYKAVHVNGQVVALKVLPPSKAADPILLARFQREARLGLKLKHPNVIRTFQVGECDGLHYLVMEYLEGESLEEALRRRKVIPPGEAVRLLHQALLGLEYIHEQGMVHRDLEPANLMLVPGPAVKGTDDTLRATVKILDIGLGRALFDEGAPALTKMAGVPDPAAPLAAAAYLAPEQARDPHGADVRSDIYSLGCILYRCLTGRPPFVADTTVVLMVMHATEEPAPLRQFNPGVPEELEDVVLQMLEKDPALRFPTPGDAALALQSFLPGFEDSDGPATPELPGEARVSGALPTLPANLAAAAIAPAVVGGIGQPVHVFAPTNPPAGSDVELVPVGTPAPTADKPVRPWSRSYFPLVVGYVLGAGTVLVLQMIGWKLLACIAAVVVLWRWKRAWFLARMKQLLTVPPPAAPVAVVVQPPAAIPLSNPAAPVSADEPSLQAAAHPRSL